MSESSAYGYLISPEEFAKIGRGLAVTPSALKKTDVARIATKPIKKQVLEAAEAMVAGKSSEHDKRVQALAFWAIVDAAVTEDEGRGAIGEPFLALDDFAGLLKKKKKYPLVRAALEALFEPDRKALPPVLADWAKERVPPAFAYLPEVDEALLDQCDTLIGDIVDEAEWLADFDDDLEDLADMLGWFGAANEAKTGLFIAYSYDL